jgi:hypothetical protein
MGVAWKVEPMEDPREWVPIKYRGFDGQFITIKRLRRGPTICKSSLKETTPP